MVAESVDVTVYGTPATGEVRERALFDLRHMGKLTGDVEIVVVRTTRRNMKSVATGAHAQVEQVLLAALQNGTIPDRKVIRSICYRRPFAAGIDTLTVSFRSVCDRSMLV